MYPELMTASLDRPAGRAGHEGLGRRITALVLTTTIALAAAAYRNPKEASAADPMAMSQQAETLVTDTANSWVGHQRFDGNFLDPVEGRGGGYGVTMIGQALVEVGVAQNDEQLIQDGIKAEVYDVEHPTGGGFEAFGLTDDYIWNQGHLAADPNWQAASGEIASFLRTLNQPAYNASLRHCFADPGCWSNKKLVGAYGNLELINEGLISPIGAGSGSRIASAPQSGSELLRQAARMTSHNAYFVGRSMDFRDAGILSDPPNNPLAYHELSTMMLGRIMETVGPDHTPSTVKAAFQRAARALVGFMAPDGDAAFIGRGQGQVWNVAASVDALSLAAHYTNNPVWRGRYLAGAERALNRLQTVYAPDSWGMPLVPRLVGVASPDYLGVDDYATTVEYNGLALWALQDAVAQLQQTQPAPPESIGSDNNGVFVDPTAAQFATVRHGGIWYAIHAADTTGDERLGFGLAAAEQENADGSWSPALPYRPLTETPAPAGPILISHGVELVPISNKITADSEGTVTVTGGWAGRPGHHPRVDRGTKWTFRSTANGVQLSFRAKRPRQTYQFRAFYEPGSQVTPTKNGLEVVEPNGRHESYTLNYPVTVRTDPTTYHSAYDENLDSSILTIRTGRKISLIKYLTKF